jgi:transmembrane sensor
METGADNVNAGERPSIREQAAGWAMRLQNDALSSSEKAAFDLWRAADPRHDSAFRLAQQSWTDLVGMKSEPRSKDLLGSPTLRERIVAGWAGWTPVPVAAVALFALLIGSGIFLWREVSRGPSAYRTQVAQIEKVNLSDGTIVTLGGDSSIEVTFSGNARRVDLLRGDALFEVEKDAARPFFVGVLGATVRVVGTKFDVRRGADQIRIAVLEGVVEVMGPVPQKPGSSSGEALQKHVLMPRQQMLASTGESNEVSVSGVDPNAFATWRTGRLFYDGAPLSEVVADANRYYSGHIRIVGEKLGAMRVTTSFRFAQIDQVIETLTIALPLMAERAPNGDIVLREKRTGE